MLTELLVLALTVVTVADGDTLVIADGDRKVTLRLAEIDAPERTLPYSQVARRHLIEFVQGCGVRCGSIRWRLTATDAPWPTCGATRCTSTGARLRTASPGASPSTCSRRTLLPLERAARGNAAGCGATGARGAMDVSGIEAQCGVSDASKTFARGHCFATIWSLMSL